MVLYLKCTTEVQKAIGLKNANLAVAGSSEAPLGNWYVNRFSVAARKAFIFMSEPTLLSFILFQGVKPVTSQSLPLMFLAGLEQLLEMQGIPKAAIQEALKHYHDGIYAKTGSRADLGSLNDLVQRYQWLIEEGGGFESCDLTSIIMGTNEMPQRRIGWSTSWEVTQSKLLQPS